MALDITLTVLIATMPNRELTYDALITTLYHQTNEYRGMVDVQSDSSLKYNIGVKRNKLLARATGKYIVFIDDDDFISDNYISLILEACKSDADCIGISGRIISDVGNQQWHISKDYMHWYAHNGVYYRTPNHISPVKRGIALRAMFPEISSGEDAEYSRRIYPLLKTEVKIEQDIYFYYPSSNKKDYR